MITVRHILQAFGDKLAGSKQRPSSEILNKDVYVRDADGVLWVLGSVEIATQTEHAHMLTDTVMCFPGDVILTLPQPAKPDDRHAVIADRDWKPDRYGGAMDTLLPGDRVHMPKGSFSADNGTVLSLDEKGNATVLWDNVVEGTRFSTEAIEAMTLIERPA